jgi:glycosyltransferase involved in cell wall biosynthesis
MVIHQFLPRHLAGSEVYTYELAQALRGRGHTVEVFFTEIRADRAQYQLSRGEFQGIPYYEAVHNRWFASFRHTYADAEMERLFRRVLDASAPDVLHIQHLHLHSIGYIDIARSRGLPILYTLHEYLLMCLNQGLLLRPGAVRCGGPEPQACATCAVAAYPTVPLRRRSRWAAGVHRLAARAGLGQGLHTRSDAAGPAHVEAVERRRREIQSALEKVNQFIAPSRFLRQQFITSGLIQADQIVHSDYGFAIGPFQRLPRRRATRLRVGYVGTISEYKGVHVIVDACRDIQDEGLECRIYGDLDVYPDYKARLLARGTPHAIRFMGRLDHHRIADALADLDALIVPSIWFENSPLTIHEAFLAGIPVLTSDCGGMAELVDHERTGLHFRTGDPADLRRQLLRLLHEPDLLASLGARRVPVKPIEVDAAEIEDRYRALLQHPVSVH